MLGRALRVYKLSFSGLPPSLWLLSGIAFVNRAQARGDEALDAVVQELARRTSQEVDPGPGGPHLVWILDALAGGFECVRAGHGSNECTWV